MSNDSIKHIRQTHADHTEEAWCGRKINPFEWAFVSIDHAAYSGLSGDYLVACKNCVAKIAKALANGHKSKAVSEAQ